MDKILKKLALKAPVSKVWHAVTNAGEFSRWFGIELQGEFAPGKEIRGTFGGELNEEMVLGFQKKLGLPPSKIRKPEPNAVFCVVDRVEPETYFSFRWIPYGIDAEVDPKTEPMTLVEFRFEKTAAGTLLTITESGFDEVPAHRRERAFRMNDGGWGAQAENVKKYVEQA